MFKTIIDRLRQTKVSDDYLEIIAELLKAKVFVLTTPVHSGQTTHDLYTQRDHKLSLPFKTCWFETTAKGGNFCSLTAEPVPAKDQPLENITSLCGFYVSEIHPGVLGYLTVLRYPATNEFDIFLFRDDETVLSKEKLLLKNVTLAALDKILIALNASVMGVVSTNEHIKLKNPDGSKHTHKIKKIIYVVPKKDRGKPIPGVATPIDWTHRWTVRGHWRKIEGALGKCRDGCYCTQGFTWVEDHTRGPEHLPLVADKVRLVKDAQGT